MKTTMVYAPSKREIRTSDNQNLDFFCGDELDDLAITVLDLKFGNITPQEAYIILLKKHKKL